MFRKLNSLTIFAVCTVSIALSGPMRVSLAQDALSLTRLQLVYLDQAPLEITNEEFKTFPRTKVETKDRDGKTITYSGVAVHHLLDRTETPLGESLRAGALQCYVSVEAKDGYRVVFALPELDSEFTDRIILLANEQNGQPLDARNGPYQIIVPDEKRHARWVRMVEKIRILESKISPDVSSKPTR